MGRWPPLQTEVGAPRPGRTFELVSEHRPTGDQPLAIEALCAGIEAGAKHQVLLGITARARRSPSRT